MGGFLSGTSVALMSDGSFVWIEPKENVRMNRRIRRHLMRPIRPHVKRVTKVSQRSRVKVECTASDERHEDGTDIRYNGLCSTCNHARTCMLLHNADRPVHYCEEFDGKANDPVRAVSSRGPHISREGPMDAEPYPGLCSNCERRETCALPRPEGGVWHCEEYA